MGRVKPKIYGKKIQIVRRTKEFFHMYCHLPLLFNYVEIFKRKTDFERDQGTYLMHIDFNVAFFLC